MTIDFSKLSISSQKSIFSALQGLEGAFSTLETVIEDTFGCLEDELTDLEAEVGDEYPLCELLGSLKAHVEEQSGNFDLCGNFNPEEKKAFMEWYEAMMDSD